VETAKKLAQIKAVSFDRVAEATAASFDRLFRRRDAP